jgi:hypothetical protein
MATAIVEVPVRYFAPQTLVWRFALGPFLGKACALQGAGQEIQHAACTEIEVQALKLHPDADGR